MKVKSNIGTDIYKITETISNLDISDSTKDILFAKIDPIYESMLTAGESDIIDFTGISRSIIEAPESLISTIDRIVIQEALFRQTTTVNEIAPIYKELDDANITEAVSPDKKIKGRLPIFFIFNGGNNVVSKSIMLFTNSKFSHVSLSIAGLDEIISFATTDQNYGLVVENWFDFCHIRKPKNIGVHFIDVPLNEYEKIKNMIEFHKSHTNEYTYSFKKMFTTPFKAVMKYKDDFSSFICSEFVYYLVVGTSIGDHLNEEDKKDILITPKEFREKILSKSTIVYEGGIENFNPASLYAVYKLYDDSVLAKKNEIDKKVEKKYEHKPDRATAKLKQLRMKISK